MPGGLPARLVAVGARTLQLSLGIIRAGRVGGLLRTGRVLPGPGFGLGRPGLRVGHRLVAFLPGRGGLFLRGLRLLFGGGLRLPRLGLPRLGLRGRGARLPRLGLGLFGAGLEPGPGLLGCRDRRLQLGPQLGLVLLGIPVGLRQLLLRGLACPVQFGAGRLGRRPLGLGDPCLRSLSCGLRLLLGSGLRLPCLGLPRLGLRRRLSRLPRFGLGLLGAGPRARPGPVRLP